MTYDDMTMLNNDNGVLDIAWCYGQLIDIALYDVSLQYLHDQSVFIVGGVILFGVIYATVVPSIHQSITLLTVITNMCM
jgi:hypothetical protein